MILKILEKGGEKYIPLEFAPTSDKQMTWRQAKNYCKRLNYKGYKDWRMPTIKELFRIVDFIERCPAIKRQNFNNKDYWIGKRIDLYNKGYWSATEVFRQKKFAYIISFFYGDVNYSKKLNIGFVLPVRGGILI